MRKAFPRPAGRRRAAGALLAGSAAALVATPADAATFTVSNTNDSGPGSLRQAILDANATALSPDTIDFAPAVTGTIALTTGQLTVSDSLTIDGPGAASLTVSGGSASRVFYIYNVDELIDVSISGVTVSDGAALVAITDESGGGILNAGENLTLENVTVSNNSAACCGGGLASFDSAGNPNAVVIRDATFSGNTASFGGGMYLGLADSGSTALVENVTISGNSGLSGGGGIDASGLYGSLTFRDSRITGNSSLLGGGIGLLYAEGPVVVEGTTISENEAYLGGGMALLFATSEVTVTESTIADNVSDRPGGGILAGEMAGTLTVENSTISGNTAESGGGITATNVIGAINVRNSTISGNQAVGYLYLYYDDYTGEYYELLSGGYGGGIYLSYFTSYASLNAESATIVGNSAAYEGGGIHAYYGADTQVSVLLSTIVGDNTAPQDPDLTGEFDSTASLIETPGSATITDNGGTINGDPLLGPLADNGGPTFTHHPLDGSPVINAGVNPGGLSTDQRGAPRVREVPAGDPDIGSVEVQGEVAPSVFTFDPVTYSFGEGAGTASVTVQRTNPSGASTVDIEAVGGTATGGGVDYTFTPVTVTFEDLESEKVVTFPIVQDALDESNETIQLELVRAFNGTVGAPSTSTVTILDDEAGILAFDPATYSVLEGAGSLLVTVTRTAPSDGAVSADVVLAGGTATGGGTDFTYATQTVSWASGQTGPRTVTLTITQDAADESDETVMLSLQNVTGGASVGASEAEVTIVDDERGTLQFDPATYAVGEGGGSVDVIVTRTVPADGPVSADVVVTGGSATGGGTDYTYTTTGVSFADGESGSKLVTVTIVQDLLNESDETIVLGLANAGGGVTLDPAPATVTILDDEPGTIQFDAASYSINEGGGTRIVTVTRTGGGTGAVSVTVNVTGGTATSIADYTFSGTTLSWNDGESGPKTFSIPIIDDSMVEGDETIDLLLENATGGAVIGTQSTSTVTITDDDVAGAFQFAAPAYTVNEEDGTITISVTRTGGSDGEAAIDVVITGGTATEGTDFTYGPVTLTWEDGDDAPKSITFTIANDGVPEVPETVIVELQNPTGGGTIGAGATTTLTIVSAAAAAAGIPTLDGWMRIVFAGLMGLIALGVIRRGRFLAAILLGLFLLTSSPLTAEPGKRRRDGARGVALEAIVKDGGQFVLTLASGEKLRLESAQVRFVDRGRKAGGARRSSVASGEEATVFFQRRRDGSVLLAYVVTGQRPQTKK